MSVSYSVTPEVLSKFKEPFGTLIEGSFSETARQLKQLIARENPPMVIAIGDAVSRNLQGNQVSLHLAITDDRSMRRKLRPQIFPEKKIVKVKNPSGVITQEAVRAVQEAIKSKEQIHIVVDGEEDLLTLVAVLYAPEKALVVYGQPKRGVVAVEITPEKRAEAQEIWAALKPVQI